ncbi:Rha family transcriptional regulator [Achromobacter sp. NCFB-sbj8-Ac1-l]|uniref:Rha family transcriptional regulator n=1 Tax=unclassified Achromobacter TaxID=2626865 RepID=UPI004046E2A1
MAMATKEKGRDSCKSATPTTKPDDTALTLHPVKGEHRIDSRVLAQHLGNRHESVSKLLTAYADDFRELGILRSQIGEIQGRGQSGKYAMLNEDQAYLLLTYSRNTAKVRALKVRLVLAFREARQAQDLAQVEYLPTYHALHNEIHALAGRSPNERFVHMNVNKLVNKAIGIGAGERGRLNMPRQSMLIAAQYVASTAMHGATDHHERYAQARDALERFGVTLLGGGRHA